MPHREIRFHRGLTRLPGFVLATLWHAWRRAWVAMLQWLLFRTPRAHAARIGIYAIGSIGDLTHTLPALAAIRRRHPKAQFVLMTNAVSGEPWAKRLGIDAALDMAIATYDSATSLRKLARDVDCLYYLAPFPLRASRALRDMLFFAAAGIRRARGFRSLAPRGWIARALRPWRTEAAQHLRLLRACKLPDGEWPELPASDTADLPDPPYVVLAPTGKDAVQHWPEEHFIEIARRLEAQKVQPVWLGLPADAARVEAAGAPPGHLLFGEQPFPLLRALMQNARCALTNDSGLAHLAGYAGTPLVVVSSARAAAFAWQPPARGQQLRLLRKDMNCEGCGLHECSDVACLKLISIDEVWKELRELL